MPQNLRRINVQHAFGVLRHSDGKRRAVCMRLLVEGNKTTEATGRCSGEVDAVDVEDLVSGHGDETLQRTTQDDCRLVVETDMEASPFGSLGVRSGWPM